MGSECASPERSEVLEDHAVSVLYLMQAVSSANYDCLSNGIHVTLSSGPATPDGKCA